MTIERTEVTSSLIKAIGYEPGTRTLAIEFKSGSVYHYANVPPETYSGLRSSKSLGAYFVTHIKPNKERFPFAKQELPPVPERPIDIIRRMNPGVDIPTGAELAEQLKRRDEQPAQLMNGEGVSAEVQAKVKEPATSRALNCISCNDGARLSPGWKCDVCGLVKPLG